MHRYAMLTPLLFLVLAVCPPLALSRDIPNSACLSCHGERNINRGGEENRLYIDPQQFSATSHSRIGCASCHDSVSAQHPRDGVRPSRANCRDCHGDVNKEYAGTRHSQKAGCADCHDPHRVKTVAASSGADQNRVCARCHDRGKMVALHGKWLPQTGLHMDALPCITCHTGSKDYIIDLYLERKEGRDGGYRLLAASELKKLGAPEQLRTVIDRNGDHRISLDELRSLNGWARGKGMRLSCMMIPKVMTHSFQTLENRWDCSFCHASGPKSNQESFLCLPQENGQFARMQVERGAVLDLIYGTPDFYILGATRSTGLNILGGVIILGGLMMPVGHGTLRFLSRKNREKHH